MVGKLSMQTQYHIECWRARPAAGVVPSMGVRTRVWEADFHNLVVVTGRNKVLDATFKTGEAANAWYVGLVDNAGFSAYNDGDTMASHAGWAESSAYAEANRQAFVCSTPAAGSADNVASRAIFTANATKIMRGAFLTDSATKGGTTGTLYGVGDFTVPRSVIAGDQVYAQMTVSA